MADLETIRCWRITSGAQAGATFVEWTARFSNDATARMYISTE
jgi:hypothetical protein